MGEGRGVGDDQGVDGGDRSRHDQMVDALLGATRLLLSLSDRTIGESSYPITAPQFRALLAISQDESCNQAQLAAELGVAPSSITRMIERMEAADLVRRSRSRGVARGYSLTLTERGEEVVAGVTAMRRRQIGDVLDRMDQSRVPLLVEALEEFAAEGWAPALGPGRGRAAEA